ncbi:MAG TPA: hypothetical protein VGH78_04725 [Solirubrobacteraceae bacterium]
MLVLAAWHQLCPAAQHRHAELAQQLLAQNRGAQDQLGHELTRRRVEAGVEDPRVGAARPQRQRVLRLEEHGVHRAPGEGVRDGAADHPTADDRDACLRDRHGRNSTYRLAAPERPEAPSQAASVEFPPWRATTSAARWL